MRWPWVALVGIGACTFPAGMETVAPAGEPCRQVTDVNGVPTPEPARLLWYAAADERDIELAGRWCETVGPAVLQLVPGAAATEWQVGDSLQVVSWNMLIGGGDLLRFLSGEFGVACVGVVTDSRAAAPFVLLLQEVWRFWEDLPEVRGSRIIPFTIDPERGDAEHLDIAQAARRCGLSLVYVPSGRNGPDTGSRPSEDKGNAILSNLPLADPVAFDLPIEGGRKVAVGATVEAPSGESVRVVSVHLDVASTLVRTVLSGNQTRVRQAMGLVAGLERLERDGYGVEATVVGADLNIWTSHEATLKRMRRAFPESPEWDGLTTRGGFPTDHILFRTSTDTRVRAGTYERIDDPYASDHYPRRLYLLSPAGSR